MSDTLGLGKLIEGVQHRDAVHVAIAPVTASERLAPGQPLIFTTPGNTEFVSATTGKGIGIVDPFLTGMVFPGQRFWMWLHPGSITSLRHEWTHPAFGAEAKEEPKLIAESEAWLRAYIEAHCPYDAGNADKGYGEFLDRARRNEIFFHGDDLHGLYELDDADDLRSHLETVLGTRINWGEFSFSCSC